ncbi:nucleoside-diphosphate-sugar epimerase [Dyadobacter sp. BE34]|uniref:Nucleoside-diphosphate-sugar epimerase n=1 Tax=Dyadobacter fermentans TaxID=94254 RepID=A0ABU1QZG4_9BACT|nr:MULTISPECIES: NAD-dependent epimerase/dehydratase family protein [Dyadobacter]MDR6806557.1 nucleoside-diphosphate-sugar epimerase [Dyadobacter fermentans]MDR7044298.1 nucleoside-diphosphate-sugar epimerase [Dyadobacter sp. BE242]MDR7198609.1 nucleoside-diphosphate-sugar epimerase [Dyadobacter sp. BE34]MDR7216571.1 nucleoside-diphosphate-sugar epimerase [Dyadobacter sp. BE31]MDR7263903.1 nucleoside-diphosphate-sugar epimerase [Dyadobacter sp. BE32]
MQTILGANGQIAEELARDLKRKYTSDIRLVSRNPKKVNDSDTLVSANLLDEAQTEQAVKGSTIVYLTVGLPMDTSLWVEQFPRMMQNVIRACQKHRAKLVFFDNTYMYPQNDQPLTELSPFAPFGKKGEVRKQIAEMLLAAMEASQIEAVICRAPEFYGPDKTQSLTNTFIFERIQQNKALRVPLKDDTLRTLIWTPDASRAMALIGNTPNAYQQTWHLPCDDNRLTYKQLIQLASDIYQKEFSYTVIRRWVFIIGGLFNKQLKEVQELLPRYQHDNLFSSQKFKARFPDFTVTSHRDGITYIMNHTHNKQ